MNDKCYVDKILRNKHILTEEKNNNKKNISVILSPLALEGGAYIKYSLHHWFLSKT